MNRLALQGEQNASRRANALRLALKASLVALVCSLSTEIGFALKFPPHFISPLWPTGAILFSVLVVTPIRHWWIYILAANFTSILNDARAGFPVSAILFLVAGVAEVLIAAVGVRRLANGLRAFDNLRTLIAYLLVAVVFAPLATAFVAGFAGAGTNYWFFWRVWFLSEALAFLMLAPAILTWMAIARSAPTKVSFQRILEAVVVACGLVAISIRVFNWPVTEENNSPALIYLPLPLLLWFAVRFGPVGANTSLLAVCCLSISGAVHGYGPFTAGSTSENVLSLQLFLVTISIPKMLLAALIKEGREKTAFLSENEARFRAMADSAPVLIWMSGQDKLCTYFNKGWLDFTGRSFAQELGNGWAEGVHPDDLAGCMVTYVTAFDARREFSMEYRLRRHDGEFRWIWDRGVPRLALDGTFFGYIGCADDISERRLAEEELRESQRELQMLSGQLLQAQETERRRIARELHDDLNQDLSLLAVELDVLGQTPPNSMEQFRATTRELSAHVKQLSFTVHALSHQLHPAKLEQLGLVSSLRSLCKEISQRYGLKIDFSQEQVPPEIPSDVTLCLYRIAQEALQNVIKHSGASRAELGLFGDDRALALQISDNGTGFDAPQASTKEGLGLLSMRERLRSLRGEIAIARRPTGGTQIDVKVPLDSASQAESGLKL